ncbi:hypothetical protein BT67DRAFT_135295 [Trichocladium antarcticum]|uniref:Uncharacterized protein n=1 Tax=Trichocladium antarcticum TaxID=1450529 RepID=A0AAN6UFR4_9PEZI|nr:hypothetical protein BT67DRAFT_135295 [Trichocladium antarcticum]
MNEQPDNYAIHAAAREGKAAVVESLLHANPKLAQLKDDDGRLPIHWATSFNQPEIVSLLISQKGFDPDAERLDTPHDCRQCQGLRQDRSPFPRLQVQSRRGPQAARGAHPAGLGPRARQARPVPPAPCRGRGLGAHDQPAAEAPQPAGRHRQRRPDGAASCRCRGAWRCGACPDQGRGRDGQEGCRRPPGAAVGAGERRPDVHRAQGRGGGG